MNQESAIKWLPFIQAVAEGKEIQQWTGIMEKIDESKPSDYYTDNPLHRGGCESFKTASPKKNEWVDIGNNLFTHFFNYAEIHNPQMWYRIKEN